MKEHSDEVPNPWFFYAGYNNLFASDLMCETLGAEESFRYLKEMKALWEAHPVEDPTARQQCLMLMTRAEESWLTNVQSRMAEAGPELRAYFRAAVERDYAKVTSGEIPFERQDEPYIANWLYSRVIDGELTWNEALERLFTYYLETFGGGIPGENVSRWEEDTGSVLVLPGIDGNPAVLMHLFGTIRTLSAWVYRCEDEALKRRVMDRLAADVPEFNHHYTNVTLNVSKTMASICFCVLPYLGSAEEKERWILDLVTKKQFATHLHSVMVQKIATALARSLYAASPELFDQVQEQIGDRPLLEYISKCALFHDVGKNDIATVVNVQARALDDVEFMAIKKHPYFGYHRFLEDPDFECYKDVILCHHKTYDGKGGYPADADNVSSPYRVIIDLITISDCFDAATDTLGRNYKRAKTVEELIAELDRDAGTRYNPAIVAHIKNTPALQEELKRIIVDERLDTAYEIVRQYC